MYAHNLKWMKVLLFGLVWVLGGAAGCVTATSAPAVLQEVATLAPTAILTSTPTTAPPSTVVPISTPTAAPASTATSVPTAIPTSTPTAQAAAPACTPLPVEGSGSTDSERDPGVYTITGLPDLAGLAVHACPVSSSPVLRTLEPHSAGLRRAGQDGDNEGMLWTPVLAGDVIGWVQASYLARQFGDADSEVAARAGQIVHALRDQDWEAVAGTVHPEKGVRFSPYTYVRIAEGEDADRVFSAEGLAGLPDGEAVYHWGTFDGSGEPINATFAEYYQRFIYDADFAWAYAVGFNEIIGRGNTINNVAEAYPQAQVVEYHLPGTDPRFGGMDWRSLRLVLERQGDTWYLVGIVHDEWTI